MLATSQESHQKCITVATTLVFKNHRIYHDNHMSQHIVVAYLNSNGYLIMVLCMLGHNLCGSHIIY